MYDAVVIGGGFYGISVARYLASHRGLRRIRLIEQENGLLKRASLHNQARIHNGYHYPRSFLTAVRSRINLPRFVADFPFAVARSFTKLYAIARRNSNVNARQFIRFCNEIGARLEPAPRDHACLFNPQLIEAAFLVEEYAFDALQLAEWARESLAQAQVELSLGYKVLSCDPVTGGIALKIGKGARGTYDGNSDPVETVTARYVFNCTYSGLNQFENSFRPVETQLKHELSEIALVEMPAALSEVGITVMDGPFFSAMPFPSRSLHSLSHVRYTPHRAWLDGPAQDPYRRLDSYAKETRVGRMMRDAARYIPALADARPQGSLFEVKTILAKSESNDGRPILLERNATLPGFFSILGGKIDNIYDILGQLDQEDFGGAAM